MKKKFNYQDKLILITGASSGIGAALCKQFALQGAHIALVGRDALRLEQIKNEVLASSVKAHDFVFDLSQVDHIPDLVQTIERKFQKSVDVLVNAAGIAVLGNVDDVPLKEYKETMTLNFFAPLCLMKTVLPSMKSTGGQIINISSGVAQKGFPGVSAYCVGKSALDILTESLRLELWDEPIDVILISPGLVKTPFAEKIPIYGQLSETFTTGNAQPVDEVARHILRASQRRQAKVVLSLRTKILPHLNYWCSSVFNRMLIKAARRRP